MKIDPNFSMAQRLSMSGMPFDFSRDPLSHLGLFANDHYENNDLLFKKQDEVGGRDSTKGGYEPALTALLDDYYRLFGGKAAAEKALLHLKSLYPLKSSGGQTLSTLA